MKFKKTLASLLLAGGLALSGAKDAKADLIYSQDFSSNPNWITNDPSNLYWDSSSETFHGWQANTSLSYAYTPTTLDPTRSFSLQSDQIINSVQWSAGLTFGIWNSQFWLGNGIQSDLSSVDGGYRFGLFSNGGISERGFQTGVWYNLLMEYDAEQNLTTLEAWERDSGLMCVDLNLPISSLPEDMNLLGVSRTFMRGYGGNRTVDYNIDNIMLWQDERTTEPIPEPSSLDMMLVGSLSILLASKNLRKK